ncbi:hypothetical protein ES703_111196 [subsurface metagenome]
MHYTLKLCFTVPAHGKHKPTLPEVYGRVLKYLFARGNRRLKGAQSLLASRSHRASDLSQTRGGGFLDTIFVHRCRYTPAKLLKGDKHVTCFFQERELPVASRRKRALDNPTPLQHLGQLQEL